jgi:hypothetical protein
VFVMLIILIISVHMNVHTYGAFRTTSFLFIHEIRKGGEGATFATLVCEVE